MKIGIVGSYGHECVKLLPGAELAWACEGSDQTAVARAAAFGCTKTFSSMEGLLADFRPDLVYIGTFYAGNGPLAMRWSASFQKARELILGGRIGRVVMIQAQKTYQFGTARPDFYKSRKLFGGIIPWVAVHAIDYAAWCTGLRYESVTATHGNTCFPGYPEMEDHAALLFQMTGGVPCVITADFLRPGGASSHGDDRLRVTGSEGVLEVRNDEVFLADSRKEHHWICPTNDPAAIQRAEDLAGAALGNSATAITTAECLHITAAALAARDAADTGCRQMLKY